MQNAKKIIPCLDMKDGRVVKGKKFIDFTDAGDPVALAKYYSDNGADEIAFLDISASLEGRKTMLSIVEKVTSCISVPFCVGGGISEISDIQKILERGASKISINSAAVKNPAFLKEAIAKYKEKIVLAVDAKENGKGGYNVYIDGGLKDTGIDVIKWVKEAKEMGLNEILLTSIDADGIKSGYDLKLTKLVKEETGLLVTASGGCGKLEDFRDAFLVANADAALAASLFHFRELSIPDVKNYLREYGFNFTADFKYSYLFKKAALIPAVIQDANTKEVLMLAYCNEESLKLTLETGFMHYYSRSREKLWKKGETSGHVQKVVSINSDCDNDTLLCLVEQTGPACHTGSNSCFFNIVKGK